MAKFPDKFQSIFETAIDGVIVINKRGIIEDANLASVLLFGYTKEEMIGNNVSMLMAEPHHSAHDSYLHAYQKTKKPKIIGIGREVEGKKKDGVMFPFRLAVSEFQSENETYYTGIVHDLTLEKENEKAIKGYAEKLEQRVTERTALLQSEIELKELAERALLESQKLYEAIAVNFPNGTIAVLDTELNIVFIEGSELKKLGFGTRNMVGRNYISLLPDEVKEVVDIHIASVFQGTGEIFEFSNQNQKYRARCVPLYNADNIIDQVLLVENNITKEKQAEDEIYNALNKEKQLNELKTKFVSMASHEFRTPLSSILTSAGLIEKYPLENQQVNRLKHIQKIKKNVHNLNMILNDFLSLEKIEGGYVKNNPETINVAEFLAEIMEETSTIMKPNQELVLELIHEIKEIEIDQFLLRNMLTNFISNAVKYSSNNIIIQTNQINKVLTISVIDEGIGISEEDQKSLFNRFYRASNSGNIQGTGLGLNIVRRYANIMNAEIKFESKLNVGSKFIIEIKL
jgi:PAS domain S-box-containing protein